MEHLGHVGRFDAREEPVAHVGVGVGLCHVGEREDVGGVELVQERMSVPGRLGEPVVEAAAAATGDVRHHAVKRLPLRLVGVEPVIEEGAQEPAALRDPPRDGPIERAGWDRQLRRRRILEVRDGVAHGGRSQPDERRVLGDIHHVVEPVRLEPAFEIDTGPVRHDLTRVGPPGEPPPVARHHAALPVHRVPDGHDVRRVARVRYFVGLMVPVGERPVVGDFADDDLAADQPGDRGSVVGGDRWKHSYASATQRHVELPSQPEQREPVLEQEPVAHFLVGLWGSAATSVVVVAQHSLAAPVRHLVEQGAVAACDVLGFDQVEVGPELHLAVRVAGRVVDVGDDPVGRIVRVDGEVDRPFDPLEGARQPVGLAVGHLGS